MGAIILNGAKIGQNCLIGAGALVKEGTEIPDNSLVVGTPGKIIRQMDIDGIKRLKNSAIEYQVKMKKFKETLNKIK